MHVHEGFHEIFKYAHLKFTVCGRSIDSPTYTHMRAQCSHASVGLAQARPNYTYTLPYFIYYIYYSA